ncbi:hypothetical protein FB45DRAFT_902967 [Roridomyces roridus]|uniref:Uncharacterized protein n=1 Tax=Roridomyces roridus TaxID=1738132 RepID=A0AAD7C3S7_9AGAR|nr:hypothetical protein FB45DRAFT_902967 [Roridomyces roridus]
MRLFSKTSSGTRRRNYRAWYRRDPSPSRRAAGYKAALSNPNTTRAGRKHAEAELHAMGRSAHVPLMTKIKRALGIHSTSRRQREEARMDRVPREARHRRKRVF